MLRILFTAALFAGSPAIAETVTMVSTQSWVEPDEGDGYFRLTTPDYTADIRSTDDEDFALLTLHPANGEWHHEGTFELNAGKLPYVVDIRAVLHCNAEAVVVTSKATFGGPEPTILFERMLFDAKDGTPLGSALDPQSRSVGGLLPASNIVGELFPEC